LHLDRAVVPRERWQRLQAHLSAARLALESGHRAAALDEVEAALALDPDFLAAQTLRDQIRSTPRSLETAGQKLTQNAHSVQPAGPPPLVSKEGWGLFEERAKQRRIDRRLAGARSALGRRNLEAARVALCEVDELSPDHPDAAELHAELTRTERQKMSSHRIGPAFAAAATFAGLVLGASWLEDTTGLLSSFQIAQVVELVAPAPAQPVPTVTADELLAIGTGGPVDEPQEELRLTDASQPAEPSRAAFVPTAATQPSRPAAPSVDAQPAFYATDVASAVEPPPTLPPSSLPRADVAPPLPPAIPTEAPAVAVAPAATPRADVVPANVASTIPPTIDDERRVRDTLQRYRAAYDDLDARSAQAVWPAVDSSALARAFDSLASQRLTFENCDVELAGPAARAVCHGSARYVPKIGSREPRIESRVWNFTLMKSGEDWQIESARAGR
jgi:hypothetical protein